MTTHTHVAIVGGGPIGIELAIALKQAGIDYVHVEAGQIGQTMSWWAPQTRWFSSNDRISIAGVPLVTADQTKATREQYLAYLRSVVGQFDLQIRTYEPAIDINRRDDGTFDLITAPRFAPERTRNLIRCDKLVLATGGTDVPRKLGIPGEDLPHVDGYLRDPHTYFGRRVLVLGGRNGAVEAALRCYHAGAKVSLSYRGEKLPEDDIKYWLLPEIKGLLRAGRIEGFFSTVPTAITPSHVTLRRGDATNGESFDVPADFVVSQIGYLQDKSLFRKAGLELAGPSEQPVFDERTMQTSTPGLYLAGTAVGGTQIKFRVFLENCHVHIERIVAHLTGREPSPAAIPQEHVESPES